MTPLFRCGATLQEFFNAYRDITLRFGSQTVLLRNSNRTVP